MRPGFPLAIALLALQSSPLRQGESAVLLEEILQAEDRRAPREADVARLSGALAHPDPLVIRRAARALGRLERPVLARHLFPLLHSPFPAVRADAAQAIAQAAQGFRGDSSLGRRGATWSALLLALRDGMREESDVRGLGMLALSLGRLPYFDPGEITGVRGDLVRLCGSVGGDAETQAQFCRAAESLVRASWRRVPLEENLADRLRSVVGEASGSPGPRRHALGALLVSQMADDSTLVAASRDLDPELRRLALTGVRRLDGRWEEHPVLARGLGDPDGAVRLEALRALARGAGARGCGRLVISAADSSPSVALTAIDLLGACVGDTAAVRSLQSLVFSPQSPAVQPSSRPATQSWHREAHALVSLARAAPTSAAPFIPLLTVHAVWQVRMYAARAATAVRDTATLARLAEDLSPNVREAAIAGLRATVLHVADPVYRRALAARDFQLVLTAATALAGTPDQDATAAALLTALDRISREQAETSRDPRIAILIRLRETGSAALAGRLMPYLEDFDPAVADSAAAILSSWTRTAWQARPRPQPIEPVTRREVAALRGASLVVLMANGGRFEVELLVDDAPATVARIVRLARRRHYDGLTFHRVAPNFVIQGGSPGANEYAGTPSFMRDELAATTHARGTLGVSTRGRDTGDGQIFVNLRDNPRLDYDYTVWGRVVRGLEIIDAVQEGDVIRRVEIRSR